MRICNYCHLKDIRRRARAAGNTVTVTDDNRVLVHPKSTTRERAKTALNAQGEQKYFQAWFMTIPDSCEC